MNGNQSDTIDIIAVNRLAAELVIPFPQKLINAGKMIAQEISQLIKECANISTLACEFVKVKDSILTFLQDQ